jgi:hypothetical protein
MSKTTQKFTLAFLVLVLLIIGMALWGPSDAPGAQPPLAKLNNKNFTDFTSAFDAASDSPRLILLLSPT